MRGVIVRLAACLGGRRSHLAVLAAVCAIAAGVVVTHSAVAMDHMGEAVAICLALAETAALGTAALGAGAVSGGPGRWLRASTASSVSSPAAGVGPVSAWPRGSPYALNVLRL